MMVYPCHCHSISIRMLMKCCPPHLSIVCCIAFLIDNTKDCNRMKASSPIAHFVGFLIESSQELKGIWASSSSISCCIELVVESDTDSNRMKDSSFISHAMGFLIESNKETDSNRMKDSSSISQFVGFLIERSNELKGIWASSSSYMTCCIELLIEALRVLMECGPPHLYHVAINS
jgi:hypothetical protein